MQSLSFEPSKNTFQSKMLKNRSNFNKSKSNLSKIIKMLCLFANTRPSIFPDIWPLFKTSLTFEQHDVPTSDCTRWVGSALQSLVATPWSWPCQRARIKPGGILAVFSTRAWPRETKPEAGLMPAGIINLFFISNLLGQPGLLEMSLSKVGEKVHFCR